MKPENIVLEGGKAGGRVFLVDFGGVQAAAMNQDFGSTVIGVQTLPLELYRVASGHVNTAGQHRNAQPANTPDMQDCC